MPPIVKNLKIDYVEFQTGDISKSKSFFAKAFGWSYVDYGPAYADIQNAGLGGGFSGDTSVGELPPLVVLKTDDLDAALAAVIKAKGEITKPVFTFPGGRRFEFKEPGGNNLAVWSDS